MNDSQLPPKNRQAHVTRPGDAQPITTTRRGIARERAQARRMDAEKLAAARTQANSDASVAPQGQVQLPKSADLREPHLRPLPPVTSRSTVKENPAEESRISKPRKAITDPDSRTAPSLNLLARLFDTSKSYFARLRYQLGDLFNWTWVIFGVMGVGVMVLIVGAMSAIFSRPSVGLQPTVALPSVANVVTAVPTKSLTDFNIQAWNGKDRFTIIIMGIDKRPGEEGTGFRTDSLILVSIDPKTNSIGLLSIPRDVKVPIPGKSEMSGINTAYVIGELDRPGYGPKLVAETIQYNFGMGVDAYIVVSFDAVINLVDAIGGVDIDVPEVIDDPEFPDMNTDGFDPLYIPAGRIHMDGQLALKYARVRHVGNDDYDRTRRQQQVILAIRSTLLNPGKLVQVVGNAPSIWGTVSKGIITNMSFDQLLSMGFYLKDIQTTNIHRGTLEGEYLQSIPGTFNGYGTDLTINRGKVQTILKQVFGDDYTS